MMAKQPTYINAAAAERLADLLIKRDRIIAAWKNTINAGVPELEKMYGDASALLGEEILKIHLRHAKP